MKICHVCGNIAADHARFCRMCGTVLSDTEQPQKHGVFATLGKILLYILMFFCVQTVVSMAVGVVIGIMAGFATVSNTPDELTQKLEDILNDVLPLISLISNVVFVGAVSLFFAVRKKNVAKEVRLCKFPLWTIPVCAVFGYCINPVISFISAIIPWPESLVEYYNSSTESLVSGSIPLTVIAISLVTGFAEEFLFRGIVVTRLRRICSSTVTVIVSAVIFAAVHLNPISFVGIFILAVILAKIFFKYDSVIPCMIVHAAFNLFAIIGFPSDNSAFVFGFIFICAAIALGTAYLLLKGSSDTTEVPEEN